ncbi:MAG: hypothetical protein IBX50_04215 [Marinospirillum sp.]|uniref:hypothetical protein n=1 Tax=Marinospirillum sp. TaxID=2183934 RepID=UPI0019D8F9C7|nr:hypothetical protein [Marinospirillum sp.]MBE0505911.1 hypothetical protein [Marinospirillum sp.]
MIKNTITNAADISVLRLIDNNYKTGGGPASVSGTVVVASKGPVGQVFQVTNDNWEVKLGRPLPKSHGLGAEGLRHLAAAAEHASYVQVVRVVDAAYRFPSVAVQAANPLTPEVAVTVKSEHAAGAEILPAAEDIMVFFIKDGDPSSHRQLEISNVDVATNRFTVTLWGKDAANEDAILESYTASLDEDARDDMGVPIFIESLLETASERLGVVIGDTGIEDLVAVTKVYFEGGDNGGYPETADWQAAWNLLADDRVYLNNVFQAGNYDPIVIGHVADIARGRYIQHFFDAPPYLKHSDAIDWIKDAGIQGRQNVCIWGAYTATDPWYGGKGLWGFSGDAAAARARANANFSGPVPGVYYTIAGTKRGTINRRGVKPLYPDDLINKDDLYTARINPILASDSGVGVYIGDSLAMHFEQNYKRFEWISSLDNHITHQFIEGASYAKFEPDGLTLQILTDIMQGILEPLTTAGAIVTPRNPDVDGDEPYRIRIYQAEIDLWMVEWDYCPVGAARRIAGQPMLIK